MKKKTDDEISAELKIWKEAEAHYKEELAKLESEIEGKVEEARAIGVFKKMAYDQAHNETFKYAMLYKVKKEKAYKNDGMTWEGFCKTIGEERRRVDDVLKDMKPIYERFSADAAGLLGLPFNKIRYLGNRIPADSAGFDKNALIIDGIKIPLSADNKDEIEAAIDALKESNIRQKEDHEAKLKAKDRVLEEKERVIQRQEKDLAKYKKEVKARGFEPGEEDFIIEMESMKTFIVGLELKMDSRNFPQDHTALMRAAYIETLGHAARVFRAYYDEAVDLFGDPEMDDDWQFPTKTQDNDDQKAWSRDDCLDCEHHVRIAHSKKGVKIPGVYGKCTRPEAPCFNKSTTPNPN
jgi:hypothetical protein